MQLFIPKNINFVLNTLKNSGFEAFLVGGCVRDMLLDKMPHDYDIATNALPSQVEEIFKKTVSTGIKHGTVTVITDNEPVEVTTFRTEGDYTDFRRPDRVEFVSDIKFDLSRRDFTVNAMAYNEQDGLIDLFGGKEDLKNGIIKAVGNPERRFKEDALRILRLYRFSSVLNFKIDTATEAAALNCADLLKNVSSERVLTELSKAVCGFNITAITPLIKVGGLSFLGINSCKPLDAIQQLPNSLPLRLFGFLSLTDCNTEQTLTLLKASNANKKYCLALSSLLKEPLPQSKYELKLLLKKYTMQEICDYLLYCESILKKNVNNIIALLTEIQKNCEPYLISDLSADGNDLKDLGLCGQEIKAALEKMLDTVCQSPELNEKEYLIKLILKDR